MIIRRREFLAGSAAAAIAGDAAFAEAPHRNLPFGNGERPLVTLPQKRAMIQLTARPPQLETPFDIFDKAPLTPNDAFFVRYHLSDLPYDMDLVAYRLRIGGHVERPLSLSLSGLRRDFPRQEIVAVNQCSGNSRGFFQPRVGGGQLGNGAMGNARWLGVPLKALLDRAGIRAGARQVVFNGLDNPPVDTIPDFIKALDIDHALDGEVMIAWAMNGSALPFLNGFPLRLVVPGYYGTYWIKHLSEINVVDRDYDGYWMKTAYRVPDNDCECLEPGQKVQLSRPISRLNIRSFVTNLTHRAIVKADSAISVRGMAFNGGGGIARVMLSVDDGATWQATTLGKDLGRYSFRQWQAMVRLGKGDHVIKVRAFAPDGDTQPLDLRWQPAGYMRNVVEALTVTAA